MIKLKDIILRELSYNQLYSKTPAEYQERATNIRVILKSIYKGRYYYKTITSPEGHVHNQLIKPRPGKQIKNISENILVWCDCENFTYENEWLLWKNNTSNVVNSNGQPLTIRNPERLTKLCKHLIAILPDFKKRIMQAR